MTSLNPVFRIGAQVDEVIALHDGEGKSKEDVKARTIELLKMVGIANSEGVYSMFPHELSGGMRQRVMIAMALACNPKVIIADEPTTALDVTIQAQILDLLRHLKDKINSSIMLITHDLGVIAEMADYVVVMYAGRVVEKGTAQEIFENPVSSLHHRPDGLQARGGQAGGRALLHPGQGAQPHQYAQLLLFQRPLRNVRGRLRGCLPPRDQHLPDPQGELLSLLREQQRKGG